MRLKREDCKLNPCLQTKKSDFRAIFMQNTKLFTPYPAYNRADRIYAHDAEYG